METVTTKTIDEYFIDWESNAFGYGYGTGEPHTIPALKSFLEYCPEEGCYDFRVLEEAVTPTVAWLLINLLNKVDIIDYGSSPRFAWLTDQGRALKSFVGGKSVDELLAVLHHDENHCHCYPDTCNCGEHGYKEGARCPNPFWVTK